MSRRGVLAVAVVAGTLALAVLGVWYLVLRDTTDPATVEEALTTFREETDSGPRQASPVPEGVYVYRTAGFEKTDALTGVTHRYPSRSTITVTADQCGLRLRWDLLEGRSTTWTVCVVSGRWDVESQEERHTFFGRTERTTYTCTDTSLRPAGDRPGTSFAVLCSTGSAEERGSGRVVALEILRVAGETVETVHVRRRASFTGRIRGRSTQDVWLARDAGVPVRLEMTTDTTNDSAVGDVHYEEHVSLRLVSLEPRR
jgi:hypothetical protein